jgi:glycosyltransferase involved in cell wall biosynthesis
MAGGTRHYDFAKELVKIGYKVTIFASSFSHKKKVETKLFSGENYRIENVGGIKFVWIRTFPYERNNWRRVVNMLSFMVKVYCLGRRFVTLNEDIRKPDVVIGSSVHLFTVLSACFLAKRYRAKFIMEVRDLWPQSAIDIGILTERSLTTKALRLVEKYLYRKAERIIILSPLTKDYLVSLKIDSHKIWLIPNGVNTSKFKISGALDRKCEKAFRVMYAGSLGFVNALAPVFKAAETIQNRGMDVKFIFVGGGIEKAKLIQESKVMKLHNVEFCEPVPKHNIPSTLKTADICLLCENRILYGSSNKLMDYMASAKPIVFSTYARHNTVRRAGCGISISPGSSEAMADAIIKLYNMPEEERKEMGKKGREYVEKHHSIPVLVNKLEKVIREVVNGKTVPEND